VAFGGFFEVMDGLSNRRRQVVRLVLLLYKKRYTSRVKKRVGSDVNVAASMGIRLLNLNVQL